MTRAGDILNLARRLLAIGRVTGRRAEAGGVRFLALLLATLFLALGLGSLVAVHAVYAGKEERRTARTPIAPAGALEHAPDATMWLVGADWLEDERRFSVVYISPRRGTRLFPLDWTAGRLPARRFCRRPCGRRVQVRTSTTATADWRA